ncbi:MAG: RecQ family zinc-binding domain-containing protein, partial [Bacteroidia bacterium]
AVLFWNDADASDLNMHLEQSFPSLDQIRSVYQALTNMYAIAPGAGAGQTYVFDSDRLVKTYKLDSALVYNSLRFLEREGYFALSDAIFQPPRLQFTTTKENLYRFEVANPNYEAFIKLLLRSFPGIFEQYVKFNEAQLAKRANMDVKKLVKQLLELQQMDLLSYLPQNELPLMTFITPRVDAKTLYISPTHLAERKQAAEARVAAMLQLVASNEHCREQTLLHWFGESDAKTCGRCDVCRKKETPAPSTDQLAEKIMHLLELGPQDPASMHRDLEIDKDELVPVVRLLIDAQKIKYNDAGFLIRF